MSHLSPRRYEFLLNRSDYVSIRCGVTSLFSDPIDIVSVGGYKGFREFVRQSTNLPIRIFNVVPGGLPVDRKFSHKNDLSISQTKSAIGERRHAEDKKGYGGQKFPKLAKPAKTTKKWTPILTCTECKKKSNKRGLRVRKVELIAK